MRDSLWRPCVWLFAAILMGTAGCQSKATSPAEKGTDDKAAAAESATPGPTTYPGKWALVLTQQIPDQSGQPSFRDVHLMLFEIREGAEGVTGEVHASLEGAPKFVIQSVKIEGDQITLQLTANDNAIDYQGVLKEGLVRGTLLMDGSGAAPAMLRPTVETAYDSKRWDPAPPTMGAELLIKAFGDKNQPAAVITAATELRGSPLSLEAFGGVFGRLAAFPQADDQTLKAIAALFLDSAKLWGPRMADQVRATVILSTASSRKYPRTALEWLDTAQEKMGEAAYKNYEEAIGQARDQVLADIALIDVQSEDAETAKAAYATLEEKLPNQRYNPEILHALGLYASSHEMPDKAIDYWGDIVSLPLLEGVWHRSQQGKPPGDQPPRELLMKLWEKKHGNVEGFDKFIEDVFNRRMVEMADEVRKAGPEKPNVENTRTVLVELFTGAMCPPCVAGDVALDLVSGDYPAPKLIALRYHQHIPGPDPLTNQDSEDRFGYYEGSGTPMILVDGGGVPAPGIGGMLQHVGQSYRVLRKGVDERLSVKNDIQITATAALENGEVVVNANAVGWPEDNAKRLRLRLALVENRVVFHAPNGMRNHEHLVRTMIGGVKGTAVKSGQLSVSAKVSLAELKQTLTEYLTQFEKNRGVDFPIKPVALEGLSIVAWVQNDENREVLQTVMVPVTGSAAAANADTPASATTPANSAN